MDGAGTLNESIFGGELTVALDLTRGKSEKPLTSGESVFVRGHLEGGGTFIFPFALQATQTHEPWKFAGKSGVKGPQG